jgi:restriction system protein
MAIPDFRSLMLPELRQFEGGEIHHIRGLVDPLADEFALTTGDRSELLPSGRKEDHSGFQSLGR